MKILFYGDRCTRSANDWARRTLSTARLTWLEIFSEIFVPQCLRPHFFFFRQLNRPHITQYTLWLYCFYAIAVINVLTTDTLIRYNIIIIFGAQVCMAQQKHKWKQEWKIEMVGKNMHNFEWYCDSWLNNLFNWYTKEERSRRRRWNKKNSPLT